MAALVNILFKRMFLYYRWLFIMAILFGLVLLYHVGLPDVNNVYPARQHKRNLEHKMYRETIALLQDIPPSTSCQDDKMSIFSYGTCLERSEKSDSFVDDDVIRILGWTDKSEQSKLFFPEGRAPFHSCQLPKGATCEYSSDRNLYNKSHAILFRYRRIKKICYIPRYRFMDQKWIFYENETPPQVLSRMPSAATRAFLAPLFNITSTYALDSTIPTRHQDVCNIDEAFHSQLKKAKINFAKGKSKLVAWFVSHCNTYSEREKYVKELERYLPVDVYGACGNLTCSSCSSKRVFNLTVNREESVLESYKFYLAFENSLCKDYITEKLWKLIYPSHLRIIPVVLGAGNYSKSMPKYSFIDIRNFRSPRDLAKYLIFISRNDALFNMYIRNKLSLRCGPVNDERYECRLCRYLHSNKNKQEMVGNVSQYWSKENQCQDTRAFYENLM